MVRTATVTRNTRETQITLTIDLDGTGKADLHTGIGFFDHMLDGFARHGLFDLTVQCHGDLEVDCHHTIEDVGIALGTAWGGFGYSQRNVADDVYDGVFKNLTVASGGETLFDNRLEGWNLVWDRIKTGWNSTLNWFITNL